MLINDDLDSQVAEKVIGIDWEEYLDTYWALDPSFKTWSSSPDKVVEVEAAIAAKGLQREYIQYLIEILDLENEVSVCGLVALEREQPDADISKIIFKIATATPEQKCLAALRAVQEPLPNPEEFDIPDHYLEDIYAR